MLTDTIRLTTTSPHDRLDTRSTITLNPSYMDNDFAAVLRRQTLFSYPSVIYRHI